MKCPFCRADDDKVLDTRVVQEGYVVRRRRECVACSRRFTTTETLEEPNVMVVKKDGVREPFDAAKLRNGLAKACWKRPVREEAIDSVVSRLKAELLSHLDNEIDSNALGEMLMKELRELDQVAFVRFASVYRQFKDVRDFVDELEPMLASPPPDSEE